MHVLGGFPGRVKIGETQYRRAVARLLTAVDVSTNLRACFQKYIINAYFRSIIHSFIRIIH